jgi:enoyl-CoA hydratase/carnithine racemase
MDLTAAPLLIDRREGGVVVLTLNNPDRRNALDPPLVGALLRTTSELRSDRTARCVVITGTGKAFCSGADLGALRAEVTAGPMARRDQLSELYRVFLDLRGLPMPVIAAVNGAAIGAGLNLALCCDICIAAESARFGATFVRLGIHPGGGATYLLTRRVGPALAAELLFSGQVIDAERALAVGLINRVVASPGIVDSAVALASVIASNSPQAVRATKRTLAVTPDAGFAATLELEAITQAITQDSDDATEGWDAFRERRAPKFDD